MSQGHDENLTRPETPRLQETMRLSALGFAKVLGDLEARVMRAVWDIGRPASARTVHEWVIREHEVALLTVTTVLNKLVDKKLLRRAKQDDLLHYEATWSEEDFRAHAARRVVEGILSFGPAALASSFIDALAAHDPEQLAELERMIHERMQREEP